jgi:GntR family transcriptional repressor for pyruvate dehydrogenase complex
MGFWYDGQNKKLRMTQMELDNINYVPVQRKSLVNQVADQIQNLIVDESLITGQKLPTERELAQRFNVSRTVIREAIRVLGSKELVEVKPGSGTYIKQPGHSSLKNSIGLLFLRGKSANAFVDLIEIRRTLEVSIARLAAQRRTIDDLRALEKCLNQMDECKEDPEKFIQLDFEFHNTLANATHNSLFPVLISSITDVMLEFRKAVFLANANGAIEGGLKHHRVLLEKVRQRDSNGAHEAMQKHLDQAEQVFGDDAVTRSG